MLAKGWASLNKAHSWGVGRGREGKGRRNSQLKDLPILIVSSDSVDDFFNQAIVSALLKY
jgi:hypothetical protein